MNALEIRNLTKSYPGFKLDNLNFTLPSGCIMGLVGENGAGKSTTIKLILDMLRKDGGSITILGRDNNDNIHLTKEEVGVVFDEFGIPETLNARQIGKIMSLSYRTWDNDKYRRLLNKFALPTNKPFKDFSRGMKMKLSIAIAMSHGSRLLLLDEPTNGLDPMVRNEVVEMFREFTRDEDHSILISSHIVSDLEKLCDYIAFLHNGRLLLCEEKDRLLAKYGIIHVTLDELKELSPNVIKHVETSPYGAEAVVLRDKVPSGINISPINIEELFIYKIKEASLK